MSRFLNEGKQLLIISNFGEIFWKGNPLNWSVIKVIEIPNTESALTLLDYYKWDKNRGFNLICIDHTGKIIWQAFEKSGQLSGELISDIQIEEGCFFANTWNGSRLSIDKKTGQLQCLGFTK